MHVHTDTKPPLMLLVCMLFFKSFMSKIFLNTCHMTGDLASPDHIAAHESLQGEHVSHHPFTLSHSSHSDR